LKLTNPGKAGDFLFFRKIEDAEYLLPLQVGKQGQNIMTFFDPLDDGLYRRNSRRYGKALRKEKE
jgi:hypothetical protein